MSEFDLSAWQLRELKSENITEGELENYISLPILMKRYLVKNLLKLKKGILM
jgi:hypothetical protein